MVFSRNVSDYTHTERTLSRFIEKRRRKHRKRRVLKRAGAIVFFTLIRLSLSSYSPSPAAWWPPPRPSSQTPSVSPDAPEGLPWNKKTQVSQWLSGSVLLGERWLWRLLHQHIHTRAVILSWVTALNGVDSISHSVGLWASVNQPPFAMSVPAMNNVDMRSIRIVVFTLEYIEFWHFC